MSGLNLSDDIAFCWIVIAVSRFGIPLLQQPIVVVVVIVVVVCPLLWWLHMVVG